MLDDLPDDYLCRRHDDFRSAAPIVEIAMQLHVTSASEKVGDYPPVLKVGDLSPCPPCPDAYGSRAKILQYVLSLCVFSHVHLYMSFHSINQKGLQIGS